MRRSTVTTADLETESLSDVFSRASKLGDPNQPTGKTIHSYPKSKNATAIRSVVDARRNLLLASTKDGASSTSEKSTSASTQLS